MRYVWLGFHILMVVLFVTAILGGFSPPKTGSLMHDSGSTIMPEIGIIAIWIVGSVVFKVIRKFSSY